LSFQQVTKIIRMTLCVISRQMSEGLESVLGVTVICTEHNS
jgi:hypothetical protein